MENNNNSMLLIESYILRAKNERNFTNEDLVGIFSPILKKLEAIHDIGQIGLHKGMNSFGESEHQRLILNQTYFSESIINLKKVDKILPDLSGGFNIISEQKMISDLSSADKEIHDKAILEEIPDIILAPVLLPGYRSYETVLGHHDPLTDLQVLGLFMASLAFSLDLRIKEDVKTLQKIINHPVYVSHVIHPNIFSLIVNLIQLDRRKRIRDANTARIQLENYLEYNSSTQEIFEDVLQTFEEKQGSRKKWILTKLRNRLFDLSRRNKMIYFKKSARYVNLTLSSVPYVLDYKNIRIEKLFIWNDRISDYLKNTKPIKLSQYLKTKENPQIGISLKKVFYEGNRDKAEYGFNQLKIAFCFLNWYNFKENAKEKIHSPLLLLPASLKKKKGISDEFTLVPNQTEAQVNPVLSYYLKELYDIKLPASYDLNTQSIDQIYEHIKNIITQKSNEVTLEIIKKPRLRLIHSLAKRSYESYQKKVHKAITRNIWGGDGNYSYDPSDYRPLGQRLFREKVQMGASVLESLIDTKVNPGHHLVDNDVKQEFYTIESDGSINPHVWEFDLCNVTLGNFNYQRMTLVNDYDSLIETDQKNEIFDSLFSENPKTQFQDSSQKLELEHNFSVIPTDPTQLNAIYQSNQQSSYIIQGPPGTGKSQTIVNLLANKVAMGKSVLFISEKRAALDVVYARMSQIGLRDICTLIHDSQSDKKSFIFDIKNTYESYQESPNTFKEIEQKRKETIHTLQTYLIKIDEFCHYQKIEKDGISIREILDVLLSKRIRNKTIDPLLISKAPTYSIWLKAKPVIDQLNQTIVDHTTYKKWNNCPFLFMDADVGRGNNTTFITTACDQLENNLTYLVSKIKETLFDNLDQYEVLSAIMEAIQSIHPLYNSNALEILDKNTEISLTYKKNLNTLSIMEEELSLIQEKNKYWKQKPNQDELTRLEKQFLEINSGFFNKLLNKKKQFNDYLSEFYDFNAQMIAPEPDEIFSNLKQEYKTIEAIQLTKKGMIVDLELNQLEESRERFQYLVKISGQSTLIKDPMFLSLLDEYDRLEQSYQSVIHNKKILIRNNSSISQSYDIIDDIRMNISSLFSLAPRLKEWFELPKNIQEILGSESISEDELTFLSAYKFLSEYQSEEGANITGAEIARITDQISELYPQLMSLNSEYIKEKVKNKFQDALDLSYIPSYEMSKDQAKLKKRYHEGRTILENEFGKKMRYKSIRDLTAANSGDVIKDLKPIWMMSPLSVSDTLPIEGLFDIVIFDEASQITVEEGIPPLYRAHQAIIVGDEMQMPPSNFFSTRIDETDEEAEYISMDSESLLNQGAKKLPQVTLGWHYRSKKEALINFSNFAFYNGTLMTIPDVQNAKVEHKPIEVFHKKEAVENISLLLENSISYHHLPNGIYMNRMNDSEAEYIAHLVRELLVSKSEKSIGIVAFSMQQQSNIESALNYLALQDKEFAILLEDAFTGSDEEEFTGLFVKNLENVQGDERDIMILSICYGYNARGKMLMNFGPINRRGGEKRLNVIFSRAKSHMVVVSSIKHHDITNEYNEGANYLKKYLHYSEMISLGENELAQSILQSLGKRSRTDDKTLVKNTIIIDQIKHELKAKMYHVETHLGQSRLKIDLGIKKDSSQDYYDLGIIIDHIDSYERNDPMNEFYTTPNILKIFGWKIYKVMANDWFKHQSIVIKTIIDTIEKKESIKQEVNIIDLEKAIAKIKVKDIKLETKLWNTSQDKYWSIKCNGKAIEIAMGEIGQTPFVDNKYFENNEEAKAYYDNQIRNRKGRGWK